MSKAVRGSGAISAEFDQRMETIQKLKDELASNEEISFELIKICDWISAYPAVRRNLNAQRFREIFQYQHICPNHEAWGKIETMIRTREAQNSVARKNLLTEQREDIPAVSADVEGQPIVSADVEFSPITNVDAEPEN
jgi:hypothetical protein